MPCISRVSCVSRTKLWMRLMLPSASPARLASSTAQVLDLLLKAIGATHHEDVGGCEEQDQDDQQHAQPPVHQQAERQHDEQGDEGGEVLAEERQPDGEQIVDAGQHDLDQAAGMLGAVERERQQQDVLEEVRHRAQPPAVRHAVGLQGDYDVGGDAAQADDGPQTEQVPGIAPQHLGRPVLGVGQEIHHLAEQHGFIELQGGHRDVGEREHDRKPALGAQRPDDPTVRRGRTPCDPVTPSAARGPWGHRKGPPLQRGSDPRNSG